LSTTADLYITVDPRVLVDAVAAVRARVEASQAGPRRFGSASGRKTEGRVNLEKHARLDNKLDNMTTYNRYKSP
jgi:hypothetical protein